MVPSIPSDELPPSSSNLPCDPSTDPSSDSSTNPPYDSSTDPLFDFSTDPPTNSNADSIPPTLPSPRYPKRTHQSLNFYSPENFRRKKTVMN